MKPLYPEQPIPVIMLTPAEHNNEHTAIELCSCCGKPCAVTAAPEKTGNAVCWNCVVNGNYFKFIANKAA